jgi:hypothetical protein
VSAPSSCRSGVAGSDVADGRNGNVRPKLSRPVLAGVSSEAFVPNWTRRSDTRARVC